MKYLCILLLVLIFAPTVAMARQSVNVVNLDKAPILDGAMEKGEWDEASGAPVALDFITGQATRVACEFRIGRVGDTLFFLVDASRIGRAPLAQKRDRDGAMWDDDGFELFLSSGNTKFHAIINALGDVYDGKGLFELGDISLADPAWNANWRVAAKAVKPSKNASGGFIIEAALDLSELPVALAKDGDQWGMQVALNLKYHNPWAVWHFPEAGAFRYDFGKLIWGGKTERVSRVSLVKSGAGLLFAGEFADPATVTYNGQSSSVSGSVTQIFDMPADRKYTLSASGTSLHYEINGSALNAVELDSTVFSPNGDRLNDILTATFFTVPGEEFSVDVIDKSGKSLGYIVRSRKATAEKSALKWNGKIGNKSIPDGDYKIRLLGGSEESVAGTADIKLDSAVRITPVNYKIKKSFPIGVWFEGHPGMAGYPWDVDSAKEYYDRHFGKMEENGINYIAVPNLPENMQDPFLKMAEKHKIDVAMFNGPLYNLVGSEQSLSESDVLAVCKEEYQRLDKYPALTRYQVKDEPFPSEIPNLVTVQRILAMVDPKRPAFSCFQQPSAMQRYVQSTKVSEALFDHYPITGKTPQCSIGDFMSAYPYWVASCGNNPHWAVLQAFYRGEDWREPSADELRSMTYVALAYGCKGLFFFIYTDMPGSLNGMVGADGTEKPLFAKTTALTKELQTLSPILTTLRQTTKPTSDYKDFVTGRFVTPKNQKVLIVSSGNPGKSQIVRVDRAAGVWKDALTGKTYTASGSVLIVPLGPGAGRVLLKQ